MTAVSKDQGEVEKGQSVPTCSYMFTLGHPGTDAIRALLCSGAGLIGARIPLCAIGCLEDRTVV